MNPHQTASPAFTAYAPSAAPCPRDRVIRELAEACRNAAANKFLPGSLAQALPKLATVLIQQHTELAALRAAVQGLREQHRAPREGWAKAGA